jgi:hypothetical protein
VGRYSAAMLAEMQKPAPDVAFLLALGPIAGVTYRFSDLGKTTPDGTWEDSVISWGGGFDVGVNTEENVLDSQNVEILLQDKDQDITKLLMGAHRHSVRGATAVVYLASRQVSSADWLELYRGRIETYSQPSQLVWSFTLARQNLPLQRESIPKPKINLSDWSTAALEVRDLPVPIIYGRISSANGENNGAIPCYYVDSAGFRYLVCAGWAKAIDTVYKDGVPVTVADYAVTHPVVNGRVYTVIDFTATQGTSAITCDVQGYEAVGDGTGDLITDPAAVAQHLLVNWIFGDYKAGAWLSASTAPVDTTSFATTFFSLREYQASVYIGAKRRGIDVFNDMLRSFEARACWTLNGKIAWKVEDFTAWSYATFVLREDELGGWSLQYPTSKLVDKIEAQYALTPTAGYTQKLSVKDLGTLEDAPEAIELPYSPAFVL